jgi:hypothetical protein
MWCSCGGSAALSERGRDGSSPQLYAAPSRGEIPDAECIDWPSQTLEATDLQVTLTAGQRDPAGREAALFGDCKRRRPVPSTTASNHSIEGRPVSYRLTRSGHGRRCTHVPEKRARPDFPVTPHRSVLGWSEDGDGLGRAPGRRPGLVPAPSPQSCTRGCQESTAIGQDSAGPAHVELIR